MIKSGVKLNVMEAKVMKGKSFLKEENKNKWAQQAMVEFTNPIIVEKWRLPAGAFSSESCGAT